MSHAELQELAPVYALGALDGDDLARFQGHLAECEACRADVRAYGDAAVAIARAAPAAAPSPELRVRVLAAVRPRRRFWMFAAAASILVGLGIFAILYTPKEKLELRGDSTSGRVEWSNGRGVFTASGLPGLPEGKVYDLWVIVDGKPRCGGRHFTPDANGSIRSDFEMDPSMNVEGFAVTVESSTGDHREPTMPLVLY